MKEYIVFGHLGAGNQFDFRFLEEGKDLVGLLLELKKQKLYPNTDQPLIDAYYVIEADKKYPVSWDAFKEERRKRNRQSKGGSYVIRYRMKNGEYEHKIYDFVEGLQYRLEVLKHRGITDILIIHTDEARGAETFLRWDIKVEEEAK